MMKPYQLIVNGKRYAEYKSMQRAYKRAKTLAHQDPKRSFELVLRHSGSKLNLNKFIENNNYSKVDRLAA